MIAVIFEVWPAEGRIQQHLDLAAALRADLATMDGFLSVERFRSLSEPGELLSLSFWRDETARRGVGGHATAQHRRGGGRRSFATTACGATAGGMAVSTPE